MYLLRFSLGIEIKACVVFDPYTKLAYWTIVIQAAATHCQCNVFIFSLFVSATSYAGPAACHSTPDSLSGRQVLSEEIIIDRMTKVIELTHIHSCGRSRASKYHFEVLSCSPRLIAHQNTTTTTSAIKSSAHTQRNASFLTIDVWVCVDQSPPVCCSCHYIVLVKVAVEFIRSHAFYLGTKCS